MKAQKFIVFSWLRLNHKISDDDRERITSKSLDVIWQFHKRNKFHAVNAIIRSFLETGKTTRAQMGDKKNQNFLHK